VRILEGSRASSSWRLLNKRKQRHISGGQPFTPLAVLMNDHSINGAYKSVTDYSIHPEPVVQDVPTTRTYNIVCFVKKKLKNFIFCAIKQWRFMVQCAKTLDILVSTEEAGL
jgi:hypothetical protein